MDPLSSFGKVRTMEEDLAAARNKSRVSVNPPAQEKRTNMVAGEERAIIEPIPSPPSRPSLPPRTLSAQVPVTGPLPAQVPPAPKKIPAPPVLPPKPAQPPAPPVLPKAPVPPQAATPAPQPLVSTAKIPAPRPVVPPLAPRQIPIKPTPAKPDLARLLPVEEEGAMTLETKKLPLAGMPLPSVGKPAVPMRPQAPEAPRIPTPPPSPLPPMGEIKPEIKGVTPEEILGIKPSLPLTKAPFPPAAPRVSPPPIPPQAIRPTLPPPTTPAYPSSYQEKRGLPFGLVAGIIGLFIVAAGGFAVWQVAHKTPAQQTQTPPPPAATTPPAPFFTPDSTNIVTLQQGRESFLVEQIRALENTPGNAQSLAYIPIKRSSDNTFLGTKDFFSTVGISLPQELLNDVDNQFTLYLRTPGVEEKTRCTEGNITDASCYSPRLGIVLKINSGQEAGVQNIMSGLEPTLLQTFMPLILGNPVLDKATPWDTATYKGMSVRFSNLPISTTSLNWTRAGQYLVIATSKNSSYSVLDKLAPSTSGTQ